MNAGPPIQTKIISTLMQAPATAYSVAARIGVELTQVEHELEKLFVSSRVECARVGVPVYRLVPRGELPDLHWSR